MVSNNGKHADDIVIVGAAGTPQGKFWGQLQPLPAVQLGTVAVKAAVERSGIDPADADEVIMGQVVPAGSGLAVPRQMWLGAGYPDKVGGLAINKACGSGLKGGMVGSTASKTGEGGGFVCGGAGEMRKAPRSDFQRRAGG